MTSSVKIKQPLFAKLASELSKKIAVKDFAGKSFPSESQICKNYSVSRNTARRAIKILENRGLLKTIQGKQRRVAASGASATKHVTNNICCLVSKYASIYTDVCNHLSDRLKKFGYNVCFTFQDNNNGFNHNFIKQEKYAACIFVGIRQDHVTREVCDLAGNIPAVVVENNGSLLPFDNIGTDEYINAFRGCQHLIDNGHRKIAVIEYNGYPRITEGIKKCFEVNGVPYSEKNFIQPAYHIGKEEIENLLASDDYTALYVAVYRAHGEAVFNYLHEQHTRIPEDLSVMGNDDLDLMVDSKPFRPDCLAANWDEFAKIATERICHRINHPGSKKIVSFRIESEVVKRGTVKNIG